MIKQGDVIKIIVPRYKELSVDKIWEMISEIDDLMLYFPDYKEKQKPDRHFIFAVLSTLRHDVLKDIVSSARNNRSIENEDREDDFVFIESNLFKEISDVMAHRSKMI